MFCEVMQQTSVSAAFISISNVWNPGRKRERREGLVKILDKKKINQNSKINNTKERSGKKKQERQSTVSCRTLVHFDGIMYTYAVTTEYVAIKPSGS